MLESELYDRESNDNTPGERGAAELTPAVPAAVFQPPQVVFQPPTARPEPAGGQSLPCALSAPCALSPRRRPGRKPRATRDPRVRPATARVPATMTTAAARDGAAGGGRAAAVAGTATRTPRRRPADGAPEAQDGEPRQEPAADAASSAGQGEGRRPSTRTRSRRTTRTGAAGDGADARPTRPRRRRRPTTATTRRRRQRISRRRRRGVGQQRAAAAAQAPPGFGRGRLRLSQLGRPAGHRGARARAERQPRRHSRLREQRRPLGQGFHQAGGQEAAAPRGPGDRPPPPAHRHRVGVPRPPRVGRAVHGGPPAQGPHPDRGARGRRAGRALREPVQPPVLRRQRLPGQGPERAAVDGGRLRRRRQGPQRGALRRRGELRRQRARGPAEADRVGAQAGPVHYRAGHQGPGRPQGRPADQPGQPARPVPGLRARARR